MLGGCHGFDHCASEIAVSNATMLRLSERNARLPYATWHWSQALQDQPFFSSPAVRACVILLLPAASFDDAFFKVTLAIDLINCPERQSPLLDVLRK